jgi:uncharacterized membrane protein YdjX (TVP38/TMEM64 family)
VEPRETTNAEALRRFLRLERLRELYPTLVIVILLCLAIVVVGREVDHHLHAIEAWVAALGPWRVVVFVAFFVVATSMIVPETVLCLLAGALFGPAWGVGAVMIGSVIACALQYWISRRFLRERITRVLASKPYLAAIRRAVLHDELRLQFLLRLAPLNPATISYLLGATGVRFRGFMAACTALTPHLILEVYLGHAGKHVVQIAGSDRRADHLHELSILGSGVLCLVVLVIVSRAARKALMEAVTEDEKGNEEPDGSPERGS